MFDARLVVTMATIKCSECRKPVVGPLAVLCSECEISLNDPQAASTFKSENKDRFELGIRMMKEYYDAIEARLAATLTFYGIIIGWLVTSEGARTALGARWLFAGSRRRANSGIHTVYLEHLALVRPLALYTRTRHLA